MSITRTVLIVAVLLLLSSSVIAEDYVVVNSLDGRDVLSGIFYAKAKGLPVKFMTVTSDPEVFAGRVGVNRDVLLIQSSTLPISGFVQSSLTNKNDTVELYATTNGLATNLDLAKRSGAEGFIVVDSAYADSALSVLPYAAMSKYYVLLTNKNNINDVKTVVTGKKLILYGMLDRDVVTALSPLNPVIIGTGDDKYKDNIAIVSKTMDEFDISRLILTDGTYLEDSMSSGEQPILLTGRIVPQTTYDFVKSSVRNDKLTYILIIGTKVMMPSYDMKKRVEAELLAEGQNKTIGLMLKSGQLSPSSASGMLPLETFSLPAYVPKLNISDVVYNTQSGKLMVTICNIGDGSAYYTVETRVKVDGADFKAFPVGDPVLIERGESLGTEYELDLSTITEGSVSALVLVRYGSAKGSIEEFTSKEGPLTTISFVDNSNVTVQAANYVAENKVLRVTLRNNGQEKAYALSRVKLMLGGSPATIAGSGTKELEPGSLVVEEFPLELSDADFAANKLVTITVDYGARPGFLVKKTESSVPLAQEGEGLPLLLIAGILVVVVIVIAAVAFYFMSRGKGSEGGKKPKRS